MAATAVLAGPADCLQLPAHPSRLLRRAPVLRESAAAVRAAAPRSVPDRAGLSRRVAAARLALVMAHAFPETAAGHRAGQVVVGHPAESAGRAVAVRGPDGVLAVAVGHLLHDAGLAPVSPDELEHGRQRRLVLVADPGYP